MLRLLDRGLTAVSVVATALVVVLLFAGPSLIGAKDPGGKTWNALAPDLSSVMAPEARALSMSQVAQVAPGHVLATGTGVPSGKFTAVSGAAISSFMQTYPSTDSPEPNGA